jgi:elongation factor G
MDKEHANFDKVVSELRTALSSKVTPLHLPIGRGESFKGYVDILHLKAYTFGANGATEGPIPGRHGGRGGRSARCALERRRRNR